jgi:hypothetical protein
MRKHTSLIAFTIGALLGILATATFMHNRLSETETRDTGPMIHVEEMIIANQYDLHRQGDEWPSPDLIATYLTSFDRTYTDHMGNRVDAYKISSTSGHYNKYLKVGLFPNDGKAKYVEQCQELPPNL